MKKLETQAIKEKQIKSHETEQAEMLKKLMEELEQQKAENKRIKTENTELKKDGASGLRRRELLFRTAESDLKEMIPDLLKDIELAGDKELKEKVSEWDLEKLKDAKFSVLMSDTAYLSLVNDLGGGHKAGDSLLKNIGKVATEEMGSPEVEKEDKEARFIAYRHGGDEFTGIIRDNLKNAGTLAKELGLKVEKSKIEVLEKFGLLPHLDVGVAHLSEGLEAFKELVLAGVEIPGGDRMRKIENLLIDIADQRATLDKMKTRIPLLMELRAKRPDAYKDLIDNLRKGAKGTTDEEVDFLLQRDNVKEFIRKKLEDVKKKNKEKLEIEQNIVEKIAMKGEE